MLGTLPHPASGLVSTPGDYKLFLRKYFLSELLPQPFHLEMELDQYPRAKRLSIGLNEGWHYGLTNWFECPTGVAEWGPECEDLKVHSSGGTAGFRCVGRSLGPWGATLYLASPIPKHTHTHTTTLPPRPSPPSPPHRVPSMPPL